MSRRAVDIKNYPYINSVRLLNFYTNSMANGAATRDAIPIAWVKVFPVTSTSSVDNPSLSWVIILFEYILNTFTPDY